MEQTHNAHHSHPTTIDALSQYAQMKQEYLQQLRQYAKAIREDSWGDVEIIGMADQAEDVLEDVMRKGIELSSLIDAYLGCKFNSVNRLRVSHDMPAI